MTITTAILIAILIAFTLNLFVLVAMIAPIFNEVKLILQNVREISTTANKKIQMISEVVDKVVGLLGFLDTISSIAKKFNKDKS